MLINGVHGEVGDSAVVSKSGSDKFTNRNLFPILLCVPEIVWRRARIGFEVTSGLPCRKGNALRRERPNLRYGFEIPVLVEQ